MAGLDRVVAGLEGRRTGRGSQSRQQEAAADAAQALNDESPGGGYRAGPELDRLPNNYDPDIWRLALAFMAEAEKNGVEAEVSIWRTYALLFRRIGRTKLRSRKNWVALVELMIAEYWENDVDTDAQGWAINEFVGVETFRELARWAIRSSSEQRDDWTDQSAHLASIHQRGQERRAKRKAERQDAIARVQADQDAEVERPRKFTREYIDAAMKEFTE